MITTKPYKGYTGQVVSLDAQTGYFHGRVVMLRDGITFEAKDAVGLQREFEASIDDYLDWAKVDGFEPEKPASGTFQVRTGPAIHGRLNKVVAKTGAKLNAVATRILEHGLDLGLDDDRVFEALQTQVQVTRPDYVVVVNVPNDTGINATNSGGVNEQDQQGPRSRRKKADPGALSEVRKVKDKRQRPHAQA